VSFWFVLVGGDGRWRELCCDSLLSLLFPVSLHRTRQSRGTPEIELDTKLPVTLSAISTPSYIEIDFLYCSVFTPSNASTFLYLFFLNGSRHSISPFSLKCGKTRWCTLGLDWAIGERRDSSSWTCKCACVSNVGIYSVAIPYQFVTIFCNLLYSRDPLIC